MTPGAQSKKCATCFLHLGQTWRVRPTLHPWPAGSPGQGELTGGPASLLHCPGVPEGPGLSTWTGHRDGPILFHPEALLTCLPPGSWEAWVRQLSVWVSRGAGWGRGEGGAPELLHPTLQTPEEGVLWKQKSNKDPGEEMIPQIRDVEPNNQTQSQSLNCHGLHPVEPCSVASFLKGVPQRLRPAGLWDSQPPVRGRGRTAQRGGGRRCWGGWGT